MTRLPAPQQEALAKEPQMTDSPTNTDKRESPWMTVLEVAYYLSVSPGTVRNWVSQRYIPFARRGRVVRFHQEKIDTWLSISSCEGRRRPAPKRQPQAPLSNDASPPQAHTTPDQPEASD